MKTEDIIPVAPQRQVAKDHLTHLQAEVVQDGYLGKKLFEIAY